MENFNLFGKLLMAWYTKLNRPRVKEVLEKLDWDSLYLYHNHPLEVTRDMYHDFLKFAVKHRVDQAMFFHSVYNLFRFNHVNHYLDVLDSLSGKHFPSAFASIVFKCIYKTEILDETVELGFDLLNQTNMRVKIIEQISLLENVYCEITEYDYLLPVRRFCPNAPKKYPIFPINGFHLEEDLFASLCERTNNANNIDHDDFYSKRLTMKHMWETDCAHCKMQLLLFKVLLSFLRD